MPTAADDAVFTTTQNLSAWFPDAFGAESVSGGSRHHTRHRGSNHKKSGEEGREGKEKEKSPAKTFNDLLEKSRHLFSYLDIDEDIKKAWQDLESDKKRLEKARRGLDDVIEQHFGKNFRLRTHISGVKGVYKSDGGETTLVNANSSVDEEKGFRRDVTGEDGVYSNDLKADEMTVPWEIEKKYAGSGGRKVETSLTEEDMRKCYKLTTRDTCEPTDEDRIWSTVRDGKKCHWKSLYRQCMPHAVATHAGVVTADTYVMRYQVLMNPKVRSLREKIFNLTKDGDGAVRKRLPRIIMKMGPSEVFGARNKSSRVAWTKDMNLLLAMTISVNAKLTISAETLRIGGMARNVSEADKDGVSPKIADMTAEEWGEFRSIVMLLMNIRISDYLATGKVFKAIAFAPGAPMFLQWFSSFLVSMMFGVGMGAIGGIIYWLTTNFIGASVGLTIATPLIVLLLGMFGRYLFNWFREIFSHAEEGIEKIRKMEALEEVADDAGLLRKLWNKAKHAVPKLARSMIKWGTFALGAVPIALFSFQYLESSTLANTVMETFASTAKVANKAVGGFKIVPVV